jgi:hypothetical protein
VAIGPTFLSSYDRWEDFLSAQSAVRCLRLDAIKENQKKRRALHRATGLCVHCSNHVVIGKSLCQKHLEYAQKDRDRRKEKGICLQCKNKVSPSSKRHCLFHQSINVVRSRRVYSAQREKRIAYSRERYFRLKREGKCTACGMPLNNESSVGSKCLNCHMKSNGTIRRDKKCN